MADGQGEVTTMSECDPAALMAASSDCEVTIRAYVACLSDTLDLAATFFDAITCETLADPSVVAEALAMPSTSDIATCAAIEQACPELLSSGSNGPPAADGCDDTCSDAMDGFCDDGGPGAFFDLCALGTDCSDCGPR